jgi:hypothetical protein
MTNYITEEEINRDDFAGSENRVWRKEMGLDEEEDDSEEIEINNLSELFNVTDYKK